MQQLLNHNKMRLLLFCLLSSFMLACSNVNNENANVNSQQHVSTLPPISKNISNSIIDTNALTFFYDPSISIITGILCKKGVYGISHEDNLEPRDTIIVVALKKNITVVNVPGTDTTDTDGSFPNEYNVDTIQLTIPTSRHSLDTLIGHIIQLKGTLYHSDNGNHFTNVLLFVKEIQDNQSSTVVKF